MENKKYIENTVSTKQLIDTATEVINDCIEDKGYFNPVRLKIISTIKYCKLCYVGQGGIANIEDYYEAYDVLRKNDLNILTSKQYLLYWDFINSSAQAIQSFNNSAVGIINRVIQQTEQSSIDIDNLLKIIKEDKDLSKFVKTVAPKLV